MYRTIVLMILLAVARPAAADHVVAPDEAYRARVWDEITIIDVRLPSEWAATGLPEGALGVPLQDPVTQGVRPAFVDALLEAVGGDRSAPIALICARGNRSSYAQDLLRAEGFTEVHDIGEGMIGGPNGAGWLARDLPVEPCRTC